MWSGGGLPRLEVSAGQFNPNHRQEPSMLVFSSVSYVSMFSDLVFGIFSSVGFQSMVRASKLNCHTWSHSPCISIPSALQPKPPVISQLVNVHRTRMM